jgi:hypothetical protein
MDDVGLACASCAQALEPADRFCEACGSPVTTTGSGSGGDRDAVAPIVTAPGHTLEFGPDSLVAPELPAHLASSSWEPAVVGGPARHTPWALVALLGILLVAATVLVGTVWSRSAASTVAASEPVVTMPAEDAGAAVPYSPTSRDTSSTQPTGTWMRRASADVPDTSPDNIDNAGRTTTYRARNMLDSDPTTAWRMDGDGSGRLITFRFDEALPISTVGLVNGYTKVDPSTGDDRYAQGRRITRVTWQLGDQVVVQQLRDGVRGLQTIDFAPITTDVVYLQIERTTAPGAEGFNRTAISDVFFANR